MPELTQLFQYDFFVNALISAVFTAISCGIIGTYIVAKRIVFISGGITHASFGGIGIGYFLGINPILGAAIFSLLSAWGIEFFSKKADIREDSTIAIMWSFGMAIGIIFIFITPGYTPNLMSYLFGNILIVNSLEIFIMGVVTLIVIIVFSFLYRPILYISFDEEYAKTHNLPVAAIKYLLISMVAITIVVNIRVIGIILVLSLLTIPQATANIFTKKYHQIMILSIIIGLLGTSCGLIASYIYDIPSGAAIIFSLVIIFIIGKIIKIWL